MALKCAITGAFGKQNPMEITSQRAANQIIQIAFGCQMYRELASVLLKKGSQAMWELALITEIKPYNEEFFTLSGSRTAVQHRENFVSALAQNTSVQVEQLDDLYVAAAITPLVKL